MAGTVPESELLDTSKLCSWPRPPTATGMDPEKPLRAKYRFCRFTSNPTLGGIAPYSRRPLRSLKQTRAEMRQENQLGGEQSGLACV